MKTFTTFLFAGLLTLAGIASAQTLQPTSAPTTTSAPAVDPKAMALLVRQEQAQGKYATLQATVEYIIENPILATTETRTGTFYYQRETDTTPPKFRIFFDHANFGGPMLSEKLEYAFDGQWLTIMKYKIKNMTRKQIAAPGETVEPLKIGKGPFPLPFNQKAADVARIFNVKTRDPRPSDPKNTDYIELTPKAGTEKDYDFTKLQIWTDSKTQLPVRIISNDRNKDIKKINLTNVQAGLTFDQKMFKPEKPAGDWQMTIER